MLILVRHGRTAANAAGLLQGRVDLDLDEAGRAEALAIARVLEGVDRVVTSPLRRARQTAEAIGRPTTVDDRWIELDYGEWDQIPVGAVTPAQWAAWRADAHFVPPGGESLQQLQQRVQAACIELAEDAVSRDIAVVTHVSPIKAAVAWSLGVGPEVSWRMFVAQSSISRIRVGPRGPVLTSFNEVDHLGG
jgi:broad specificity phosphatase PhoE